MHPDPRDPASRPDNLATRETSRRIPATRVSCHPARRVTPDPELRRFRAASTAKNPRNSASGPDNPRNSRFVPPRPPHCPGSRDTVISVGQLCPKSPQVGKRALESPQLAFRATRPAALPQIPGCGDFGRAAAPGIPASRHPGPTIPATRFLRRRAVPGAPDPELRRFQTASTAKNPRNSASGPANPRSSRFASPDMPLHDAVAPFDTPSHTAVTGMVVAVVSNGCTFPEATVTGACRRISLSCVGPSVMEIMCGFQCERKHRARLERPCGKRASVMRGASCGKPSPSPQHRFNPPVNRCFHAFDKPLRSCGRGSVIKPCAAGRPQFHYSSAKRRPYSLFFRKAF